eukprot:1204965-Rhodomonas_salina.2
MEAFQDFSCSMNDGIDTTTSGSDKKIVMAPAWEQAKFLEEAVAHTSDDNSSAPTPSEECRSFSPHSENGSDGKGGKRHVRPWTKDEHAKFLVALEQFRTNKTEKVKNNGKQSTGLGPGIADLIALIVKTRDAAQVRSHAQKHFQRLRRERKMNGNTA